MIKTETSSLPSAEKVASPTTTSPLSSKSVKLYMYEFDALLSLSPPTTHAVNEKLIIAVSISESIKTIFLFIVFSFMLFTYNLGIFL